MSSTDNPTQKDDSLIVVSKNELYELHDDVIGHIKRLSQEMDRRFEQVDRRFEQVDRRFEQVDKRFDAMDARFEAQDQRFEAHDKCFVAIERNIAHIVTVQQSQGERLLDMSTNLGELTRDAARTKGDIGKMQKRQLALLEDIRARLS